MRTSETRSIQQCTYTPVVNDATVGDDVPGFRPKLPYIKLAIMHSALIDSQVSEWVLSKMADLDDSVARAAQLVVEGDSITAGQTLLETDVRDITAFAKQFLNVEAQEVESAHSAVEGTLASFVPSGPGADTAALASDLADLRSAVVRVLADQPAFNASFASMRAPSGIGAIEEAIDKIEKTSGLAVDPHPIKVGLGDVQQKLSASQPEAMAFLGKTGFFTMDSYVSPALKAVAGHGLFYLDWYRRKIKKKKAQLSTFENLMKIEPVGFLHLEKLNFTPVGYELGELVYSLPMLPRETVRLTHREWTRTESEFEKVIAESLESFTEEALTEKSELTSSTQDERKHTSAFNASAKVSGGYGPVTISTEVGYNATSGEERSRTYTSKNAREVTQKASSRVKKEQKTVFKVTTTTEVEDTSYREIKNDTDEAVRWDFHRLMKRWKVSLYRFDVRLTYDLVIPEPASYLMRKYVKLARLREELDSAFDVAFTPTSITRGNWPTLGARYGVALDAPPPRTVSVVANDFESFSAEVLGAGQLEVELPDGYHFKTWNAIGDEIFEGGDRAARLDPLLSLNSSRLNAGGKNSNHFVWTYYYDWSEPGDVGSGTIMNISVFATGELTAEAFTEWQAQSYERLVDAARGQYETRKQALQREINQLENELYREDSLVLRKIEKEEVMKGVLRWLLGPEFSFYPPDLPDLGLSETDDLDIYGSDAEIRDAEDYENLLKHGELIRFLHQAIEWENVIYLLYPYFWTDNTRWDLKQSLFHNEYVHRSFLRAGAARVVLTIRPGYEKSFLSFMETLDVDTLLPDNHPYVTVAEEMRNMANESYPFVPLANEPPKENLVDEWYEFTPTGALDVRAGGVLTDGNREDEDDGDGDGGGGGGAEPVPE